MLNLAVSKAARKPAPCGILDLRESSPPTCWTEARTIGEDELVARMVARFDSGAVSDLVDIYESAHRLPGRISDGGSYMRDALTREAWNSKYIEFCFRRYARREFEGRTALEAGCGSGGMLPHLAEKFDRVVGVDVDLPALVIATKRCAELGISDRVTLIAATLEQDLFLRDYFDFVKCTDVLEHVADPELCCKNLVHALKPGGAFFVLTPNKYSFWTPEPHVQLWGVQFLPRRLGDWYTRKRIGVSYSTVARLPSYWSFMKFLEDAGPLRVQFVPAEDKYLNPGSARGRRAKALLSAPPLSWLTRFGRPFQQSFEALCLKSAADKTEDERFGGEETLSADARRGGGSR